MATHGNEETYFVPKRRSFSNSNFQNNEERTFEKYKNETQNNVIESAEKRIKTQTFFDNTFNTKIAKKLTMENQKSLKNKKSKPDLKGNSKGNLKNNVSFNILMILRWKKFKRKTFEDELNQEWIENLLKEFDKEKNLEKLDKNLGQKTKKEPGSNKKDNITSRILKDSQPFPSGKIEKITIR